MKYLPNCIPKTGKFSYKKDMLSTFGRNLLGWLGLWRKKRFSSCAMLHLKNQILTNLKFLPSKKLILSEKFEELFLASTLVAMANEIKSDRCASLACKSFFQISNCKIFQSHTRTPKVVSQKKTCWRKVLGIYWPDFRFFGGAYEKKCIDSSNRLWHTGVQLNFLETSRNQRNRKNENIKQKILSKLERKKFFSLESLRSFHSKPR